MQAPRQLVPPSHCTANQHAPACCELLPPPPRCTAALQTGHSNSSSYGSSLVPCQACHAAHLGPVVHSHTRANCVMHVCRGHHTQTKTPLQHMPYRLTTLEHPKLYCPRVAQQHIHPIPLSIVTLHSTPNLTTFGPCLALTHPSSMYIIHARSTLMLCYARFGCWVAQRQCTVLQPLPMVGSCCQEALQSQGE